MRALVTGATGFIGGALAESLAEAGWEVRVLARPQSITRVKGHYEVVAGDLAADLGQDDAVRLRGALAGVDVVVHAAAIRNRWGTPPQAYYSVNVAATRRLLEAARQQVRRFVYVSSVGVFGRPGVLGIDESFPVQKIAGGAANWDYHTSKAEAERVTMEFAGDLEVVIARPTITYGPGDTDGMVTRLVEMIAGHRFLHIGNGKNHVHLTYISDLIEGLKLVMTEPGAVNQTFILSGPEPITMQALIANIEKLTGAQVGGTYVPASLARLAGWGLEHVYRGAARLKLVTAHTAPFITRDKVDNVCAQRSFSHQKATHLLGYAPKVGYLEGLRRTINWMGNMKHDA
jgi:nucleoside-diphosphate-sugar epimerase